MTQPTSKNGRDPRPKTRIYYIQKGFLWYILNMIIGNSPILIIWGFSHLTGYKYGSHVIENLLHKEAIVMFTSSILMGAVMIDFFLGDLNLNKYQVLAILAPPAASIAILVMQYFLLHENIVPVKLFDFRSLGTPAHLVMSLIYCVFGKSYLFLKEDSNQRRGK